MTECTFYERILTAQLSASRLAMYGAPAAVGVLLFANGIPRVQRDILQVRNDRTIARSGFRY
jgi:hypothetical protein